MATKNYNVRFRSGKADEDLAWEHLHSEEVRHAIHGATLLNNDAPFVSVRISEKNGFLFMEIKNSFHDRLEIDPGSRVPVAVSSNEDGHGLGIPNSLAICDRYYGTLVFSQDGNSVTVDAMMQYPYHS